MEANRKRRGFMKGKLIMSIYKAAKPSSTAPYSSKLKQNPLPPASVGSGGGGGSFIINQVDQAKQKVVPHHLHHHHFIVNQDQVVPQQNQKVSFMLPANGGGGGGRDSYGFVHDNLYVDESVDVKASTYISTVRERLRVHHRVNLEQKKIQDMQN